MQIILIKDVEKLGYANDIVDVKPGYANNYLLPQGYAKVATESAKKVLAENLKQRAHKLAKIKADAEALARKISVDEINHITKIDKWFIHKIKNLVDFELRLKEKNLTPELYMEAKEKGFLDAEIAVFARRRLADVEAIRKEVGAKAGYRKRSGRGICAQIGRASCRERV